MLTGATRVNLHPLRRRDLPPASREQAPPFVFVPSQDIARPHPGKRCVCPGVPPAVAIFSDLTGRREVWYVRRQGRRWCACKITVVVTAGAH